MADKVKSVFETLNNINVNGHTEKKNGLTYLSWAWAWAEVKKVFPSAYYTIYENADGLFYHTDGHTCWVKTGVTIEGMEHIEYLPVMDFRKKSIPVGNVTSFDVNTAIQRSLTKACARHGLGLYIYAGEDLPEQVEIDTPQKKAPAKKPTADTVTTFERQEMIKKAKEVYGTNYAQELKHVSELCNVINSKEMTREQYTQIMQALSNVKVNAPKQ